MTPVLNENEVKNLVEIITREVLIALQEHEHQEMLPTGAYCSEECAEGICVKTCFNGAGQVVDAGASRLTSTLGGIPEDPNIALSLIHI